MSDFKNCFPVPRQSIAKLNSGNELGVNEQYCESPLFDIGNCVPVPR